MDSSSNYWICSGCNKLFLGPSHDTDKCLDSDCHEELKLRGIICCHPYQHAVTNKTKSALDRKLRKEAQKSDRALI